MDLLNNNTNSNIRKERTHILGMYGFVDAQDMGGVLASLEDVQANPVKISI